MDATLVEVEGQRCLVTAADGPPVCDAGGARDLTEEAMNHRASVVVVPVERLDASFFQLRSGLAGEVLQKVLNYHLKIAILGDVSAYVAASDALRDFVAESNRGRDIFFVSDMAALEARLAALARRTGAAGR